MEQQKISVSGPPELLAILPYHLGFRPTRSVVIVCLHAKQMGLVVRLDVAPGPTEAAAAARSVLPVLQREARSGAMVIGYEDEVGESDDLADAIVAGLEDAGITIIDRIVVRGDRWTGLMCTCCPDEPVPDPHEVAAVASYVGLGRVALDSREELGRTLRPAEPPRADLAPAVDEWVESVLDAGLLFAPCDVARLTSTRPLTQAELCVGAWGELLSGRLDDSEIGPELLCLLLGGLRHRGLRDGIIATLCPESLSRDALDPRLVELLDEYLAPELDDELDDDEPDWDEDNDDEDDWELGMLEPAAWGDDGGRLVGSRLERLCRLAPDSHAAPVLTVTGAHAWYDGDGVTAGVAIERALELEPSYVLARLLGHLIDTGVRPPGVAA